LLSYLFETINKQEQNHQNQIFIMVKLKYDRILKAVLSWSPTSANFCHFIASSSVVQPQFNLTNLKLEYQKKKDKNTEETTLHHISSDFFEYSLSLKYGRWSLIKH